MGDWRTRERDDDNHSAEQGRERWSRWTLLPPIPWPYR